MRSARKHLGWYAAALPIPASEALAFRQRINTLTTVEAQLQCVGESIDAWAAAGYNDMNLQEENWKLAA
ncbi:MAG: hypothetical protein IH617_02585 [Hydrogenophaga sp.]|nr:hypothetical protein [Hydrogenophaga sp.]